MKTTIDLIQIAGSGANLIIDASSNTTIDLIQIAGAIKNKGGHLTLKNIDHKSTVDLIQISGAAAGHITLDLS